VAPPSALFGPEPVHDWCYYYEKADLARQRGEWDEVVRLYREARGLGLEPADAIEWLPFYQALTVLGDWAAGEEVAKAFRADQPTFITYCNETAHNPWREGNQAADRLCAP
jgi:hypothetical protein